jgi:hypothetical protein
MNLRIIFGSKLKPQAGRSARAEGKSQGRPNYHQRYQHYLEPAYTLDVGSGNNYRDSRGRNNWLRRYNFALLTTIRTAYSGIGTTCRRRARTDWWYFDGWTYNLSGKHNVLLGESTTKFKPKSN